MTQKIEKMSKALGSSTKVSAFNTTDHDEADALAHAILDMETTFEVLSKEVFPKLLLPRLEKDSLDEVLWEIRDHLRHVVYHIRDCETFKDILDE